MAVPAPLLLLPLLLAAHTLLLATAVTLHALPCALALLAAILAQRGCKGLVAHAVTLLPLPLLPRATAAAAAATTQPPAST